MKSTMIELAIHLLIVLPIILCTLTNWKRESLQVVAVFALYFLAHGLLLMLPTEVEVVRLTHGNWNWSGKIYATLGSVIFLLLYRKFELKDYFLTFKQEKGYLKQGLILLAVIFLVKGVFNYFYLSPSDWDLEALFFQATVPGLDEEIAFRGIMMGLLVKVLKPTKRALFHPAIIVTALLFGMVHGFHMEVVGSTVDVNLNLFSVLQTGIMGVAWGWMTLKSGSILLALISHNLGNVTSQLISSSIFSKS